MEAIVELIAALVMGLVELVVAVASLVAFAVAACVEFVFVLIFGGLSAAKERFDQRQNAHAEAVENRRKAKTSSQDDTEVEPDTSPPQPARHNSNPFVIVVIALFVVGGIAFAVYHQISEQIRKRKIAATDIQIGKLADDFEQQIKDGKIDDLPEGVLADKDAWGKPLELFVDDLEIGAMVVVRSAGPDKETGTIDDQLAIRTTRIPMKQVAKDVKDNLKEKAAKKANEWLDKLRGKFKKE